MGFIVLMCDTLRRAPKIFRFTVYEYLIPKLGRQRITVKINLLRRVNRTLIVVIICIAALTWLLSLCAVLFFPNSMFVNILWGASLINALLMCPPLLSAGLVD